MAATEKRMNFIRVFNLPQSVFFIFRYNVAGFISVTAPLVHDVRCIFAGLL